MTLRRITPVLVLAALAAPPARAHADSGGEAGTVSTSDTLQGIAGSARSQAQNWLVLPRGEEVGGELRFVTSAPSLGGQRLELTDLVLVGAHVRYSLRGKAEAYGGVTALLKQPSYVDEPVFQGATLGLRAALGTKAAGFVEAGVGPLLDGAGTYEAATVGLTARKPLDEIAGFQGAIDAAYTPMQFSAMKARPWLAELEVHGELLIHDPHGDIGAWLGTDIGFPLAHAGMLPGAGGFDPQTRVGLRVGAVLSWIEEWDLYTEFAVIDRGDLENPATTLPVLAGGFDQRQMLFGVTRRYGTRDKPVEVAY